MTATGTATRSAASGLLGGWISRLDLALELGLTVDTLRRWEAQRFGPPCVRAGRKVYYRRDAVHDWLQLQEVPSPRRAGGRRGREQVESSERAPFGVRWRDDGMLVEPGGERRVQTMCCRLRRGDEPFAGQAFECVDISL